MDRAYRRRRVRWDVVWRMAIALFATTLFVAPIFWMVSTAFKTGNQAFAQDPVILFTPTLDNFEKVFFDSEFGPALITSLQVSIISTILAILLASSIAYPLARLPFRGQSILSSWILSLRIVPPIVTIIPIFLMLRTVNLTGTIWSIILMDTFMNLPLAIWLLRGFYAEVPTEITEAASLDGLGHLGTFVRVVLPLSLPGVASTALFSFVFSWNEFLFANILSGADTRTAMVALTEFVTPVGTAWTKIMAAGTIVVVPVWIAALAAQRYIVRGLTFGATK
jgi:ABC-type glycerol-3-phosphate transport system permease component